MLLLRHGEEFRVGALHGPGAVLLPGLFAVPLLVGLHGPAFERLEFFLVGHGCSSFCLVDGLLYRQDQGVQPLPPGLQLRQVALQRRHAVEARRVQDCPDGFQLQPQLLVKQDGLEPVYLLGTIEAVARFRGPPGLEKPLLVVPAQRPGRDSGQLRQSLYGVFHGCIPPDKVEYKG